MLLASQRNVTALLTDKIQVLQLREVKQSTVYKNGIFLAKMLKMSIEVALLGAALCPVVKTQAECDISQSHDYFQSFSFQQACVIHLSTIQFYPRV